MEDIKFRVGIQGVQEASQQMDSLRKSMEKVSDSTQKMQSPDAPVNPTPTNKQTETFKAQIDAIKRSKEVAFASLNTAFKTDFENISKDVENISKNYEDLQNQFKDSKSKESLSEGLDQYRSSRDLSTFGERIGDEKSEMIEQIKETQKTIQSLNTLKKQALEEVNKNFAAELKAITDNYKALKKQAKTPEQIEEVETARKESVDSLSKNKQEQEETITVSIDSQIANFTTVQNEIGEKMDTLTEALQTASKIQKEMMQGEREVDDAPKGDRKLGLLEEMNLRKMGQGQKIQKASSRTEFFHEQAKMKGLQAKEIDPNSKGLLTKGERRLADSVVGGVKGGVQSVGNTIGGSVGGVVNFGATLATNAGRVFDGLAEALYNPLEAAAAIADATISTITSYAGLVIPKGMEYAASLERIGGMTGKSVGGLAGLGYNNAEAQQQGVQVAQSLGTNDRLQQNTAELLTITKGTGLGDVSALSALNESFKYYGNATTTTMSTEIGKMISLFDQSALVDLSASDFTRLATAVQQTAQLDSQQVQRFKEVDSTRSAELIAGLELIGGTFKGQTGKLNQIDTAITNPQNDYIQAVIFRALQQEQPNMDLRELMKRQEAGVFGEGNFDAVMRYLEDISGGGGVDNDQFVMNVARVFTDNNISNAEQLIESGRMVNGDVRYDAFDRLEADEADAQAALQNVSGNVHVSPIVAAMKDLDNELMAQGSELNEITLMFIQKTKKFIQDPLNFFLDEGKAIVEESQKMLEKGYDWFKEAFSVENIGNTLQQPEKLREEYLGDGILSNILGFVAGAKHAEAYGILYNEGKGLYDHYVDPKSEKETAEKAGGKFAPKFTKKQYRMPNPEPLPDANTNGFFGKQQVFPNTPIEVKVINMPKPDPIIHKNSENPYR